MALSKSGFQMPDIGNNLEACKNMVKFLQTIWKNKKHSLLSETFKLIQYGVGDKSKEIRKEIFYFLVKNNIVDLLEDILTWLHSSEDRLEEHFSLAESVYSLLMSSTDASECMVGYIAQNERFIKILENNLSKEFDDNEFVENVLRWSLVIVSNIVQVENTATCFSPQLEKDLRELCKLEDYEISIFATFSLPYVLKDESIKELNDVGIDIVEIMLTGLKNAFCKSNDNSGRSHISVSHNFSSSAEEFLSSLSKLCINPQVQQAIIEHGGMETFFKFLNSKCPEEVQKAIRCFKRLAFNSDICQKFKKSDKLRDLLEYLSSNHKDSDVRREAGETLICIVDEVAAKEVRNLKSLPEPGYDIFISYCHKDKKDVVMNIVNKLKKEYKIWIDEDCMSGNILTEMNKGISNSKVFIPFMSKSYNESKPCETEAFLAWKKTGLIVPILIEKDFKSYDWLESIIGDKLYYDLSGAKDSEREFSKLIAELKKKI